MSKHGSNSSAGPIGEAIDRQVMRAVVGNDSLLIRELAAEFLPGARAGIGEITDAVAARAAEAVHAASHKLKGSCALVGARYLIALSAALESAAKTDDWSLIGELAGRLDGRMREVEQAIGLFLADIAEE